VEWAKQDWYFSCLEFLQLHGNSVDVFDKESVVRVGSIGKRICNVEIRCCGIESRPPGLCGIVVKANGGPPMPNEGNDATFSSKGNSFINISR